MFNVHVLGWLCYYYYCLHLVVSQAVLNCSLMGLPWYVYVVGPRGIVQLISVLALHGVCSV